MLISTAAVITYLTGVNTSISLFWTFSDDVLMTALVYNTRAHYKTHAGTVVKHK